MKVGIDPDIDKIGVACLVDGLLIINTMDFVSLIDFIRHQRSDITDVYVEAGWLNKKASWHAAKNMNIAANIGMKVGQNQAVGKLIVQSIRAAGLNVIEVKPTSKKLDADQFKRLTKYQGRTNQETRDAAMLIWGR